MQFEWLVYTGGLEAVEVPHDEGVSGGYVIAERDKAAQFPKVVADELMKHGEDSAEENPVHQRQWRKATPKEIAAAEKTGTDNSAEAPEPVAEEGDQS